MKAEVVSMNMEEIAENETFVLYLRIKFPFFPEIG
jgi:hypothetical protein